jgi:hypothetical protein
VLLAALPAEARAQSKKECADAYVAGQVARKEGRLREARAKIEVCADAACPATLQRDCKPWLAEIDRDTPRLDVQVKAEDGGPVEGASVTVDLDPLSGPTAFDPGNHVVKVEAKGMTTSERRVTLRAGEGTRTLEVRLARVQKLPEPARPRPVPVGGIVLTAIGGAALAVFAGLGVAGNAKKAALDAAHCAPHCSPSDVGTVRSLYVGADVSLGLGLGSLVTAAVLYAVHFTASPAASVILSPATGGGAFAIRF